MPDKSRWIEITEENPDHSAWYIQRFKDMAAEGRDLDGEARFVDAMVGRNSRILDAGCGPGRVAAQLTALGHDVVGADVDPALIAEATAVHPETTWFVADLASLDLPAEGVAEGFDVIVSAGNVMTFLAPSTRRDVLRNLRAHLRDEGRVVIGFGAGRDYEFADFFADAEWAGLESLITLSSWDLRPFSPESDFIVAVLGAGAA
jgi:SAM-dependent methyltransferase